jgi:hypothetical protein
MLLSKSAAYVSIIYAEVYRNSLHCCPLCPACPGAGPARSAMKSVMAGGPGRQAVKRRKDEETSLRMNKPFKTFDVQEEVCINAQYFSKCIT